MVPRANPPNLVTFPIGARASYNKLIEQKSLIRGLVSVVQRLKEKQYVEFLFLARDSAHHSVMRESLNNHAKS